MKNSEIVCCADSTEWYSPSWW